MTNMDIFGELHEQDANTAIGTWLNAQKPTWSVQSERRGVMRAGSGLRPDIVVREGERMPVIIETEYGGPAVGDARGRLGESLLDDARPFTEVIALGINRECQQLTPESLIEVLNDDEEVFTVQLVSLNTRYPEGGDGEGVHVWPSAPIPATPSDLVAYIEYAQVPQAVIEEKSFKIADTVRIAGETLRLSLGRHLYGDDGMAALRELLNCETDTAATRTACAIWLITFDLQNDLAQHSDRLGQMGLVHTNSISIITPRRILAQWEIIRSVNYLPVVELAIPTLEAMPPITSLLPDVLFELAKLTDELNAMRAKHIYNFAGELWQEVVVDREERAAHYTKPAVAELLATLAATRFSGRTAESLMSLDLMDAACGTGTLIGAGERAVRRLYRLAGGRDEGPLHKRRMENHVIAMDVNGIAGTLTAKRLTDLNVEQVYDRSKVAVTDHEAGSLSLLDPRDTAVSEVLGYRDVVQESDEHGNVGLFHVGLGNSGVDWSLMNPPYTRPFKGRVQATGGLGILRNKARRQGYAMSNGQAGLATDFGNLSMMRMKGGGVLSHVLPMTAAYAETWRAWRAGIETHFENIVAITNTGDDVMTSMSADTGMSEMLVVATRKDPDRDKTREWEKGQILCVNLLVAPATLSEGYALAKDIDAIEPDRMIGRSANFSFVRIRTCSPGFPWYAIGNANSETSEVSAALIAGEVYNPRALTGEPMALPMKTLRDVCDAGPTHHRIGHPAGGDPIGAFEWAKIEAEGGIVSGQMSLWSTNGKTQTRMIAEPTHTGRIVDRGLAQRMIEYKSRWFFNRNLRWTSQALLVAKTQQEHHGGSSWNALQFSSDATAACVALFFNSIFGSLVLRAYGQSSQVGRARVQVNAIPGVPCPDFGASTDDARRARKVAAFWFDSLSDLELEPFRYCFRDRNRHQIDNAVAEMLGFAPADKSVQDMLAHWRLLFASEPNIRGEDKNRKVRDAIAQFMG